jgi:hypothetical protein
MVLQMADVWHWQGLKWRKRPETGAPRSMVASIREPCRASEGVPDQPDLCRVWAKVASKNGLKRGHNKDTISVAVRFSERQKSHPCRLITQGYAFPTHCHGRRKPS